ncbi:29134_t:CDS:1, partial [Gigaspora margarita]
ALRHTSGHKVKINNCPKHSGELRFQVQENKATLKTYLAADNVPSRCGA